MYYQIHTTKSEQGDDNNMMNDFSNQGNNSGSNNNGSGTNNGNNNTGNTGTGGGSIFTPNVPVPPPGMPLQSMPGSYDPMDMLINYNTEFKNAGTCQFRDKVIQQLLSVLIGKNKPNALLIGPAGVGKTKIVEDIAYRIANDDPLLPDKIKKYTIYELPLSNIVAGSGIVGQLEDKIKCVIDFIEDPKERAILFIDEIHQIANEHSSTYRTIAEILKPALARGKMKVIGASTLQEANDFMKNPALNRRFSRIIVDELTQEQTIQILINTKMSFLMHYNNKISLTDDVLAKIADYADQYRPVGSHRPDNAITLLDRVCGEAIVRRKKQEVEAANDPVLLAAIQSVPIIPITNSQIENTSKRLASGNSMPDVFNKDKLEAAFARIQGQSEVLTDIMHKLARNDLRLDSDNNRPLTMLFAGPSGVGKSEVAKIIAQEITGTKPIILNMTEYHSSASINRIIGAPPGYAGSDSHMELPFDSLESNPYQTILLDEMDKADESVQTLFYQAFDEGVMKTNQGKEINFSKAIIIITTNAGNMSVAKPLGFDTTDTPKTMKPDVKMLSKYFPLALLNRIKNKYTFNPISKDVYKSIMVNIYTDKLNQIRNRNLRIQLPDMIPDDVLEQMVKDTYVEEFGARPAYDAVMGYIEDQAL